MKVQGNVKVVCMGRFPIAVAPNGGKTTLDALEKSKQNEHLNFCIEIYFGKTMLVNIERLC